MAKLTKKEMVEYKRYRKPSTTFHRCKVNEFIIFPNNTYKHEQGKFRLAYNLRKRGHNILTECEDIKTKERCDLVDLTDGERYEVETDPGRAKRFIGRPVNVVPLGWKLDGKKWQRYLAKHTEARLKEMAEIHSAGAELLKSIGKKTNRGA